jgi:Predicted membrane protein
VRTLYVSGAFAAADTLLKTVFIFGMHVPLFLYGCACCRSMPWLRLELASATVPMVLCVVDVKRGSVCDCSGDEATTGDLSWAKWSYWLLHSLLFLSVYTAILVLPHTRWRVGNVQCIPCRQLLLHARLACSSID